MTKLASSLLIALCACAPVARVAPPPPAPPPPAPPAAGPTVPAQPEAGCRVRNASPVKRRQLYSDHYGTKLTLDASWLATPARRYRWGIANTGRLEMAYFGAFVNPGGKYGHFRGYLYVDAEVKAPMVFTVRAESHDGAELTSVTVEPGDTKAFDVEIAGVKRLYVGSELRIQHGHAEKLVIGEPEFYDCK